jgi:hypothetical protein
VNPWLERVPMLSVNPDAATRHDVAYLAAELMEARRLLCLALEIMRRQDVNVALRDAIGAYLTEEKP